MATLQDYARHSAYSDPGPYSPLLDALPTDLPSLAAVVRNIVVHYRAAGITFTGDRLAEVDNRWLDRLLATDQRRFPGPLDAPRPLAERVAGCCRDFTLLAAAALRQHGVPARSRIGFAGYFAPDFHYDHVVVEYWNGDRWVYADAELDPARSWPFDPCDVPRLVGAHPGGTPPFETAAQVWTAHRRGEIDVDRYGVAPDMPFRGAPFARRYVLLELAHRERDELLLWDGWGAMEDSGDPGLIDEIAGLLLAADGGDEAAERELADRYRAGERLNPDGQVRSHSPTGNVVDVDLRSREPVPAG
jgi:hypothetical protein